MVCNKASNVPLEYQARPYQHRPKVRRTTLRTTLRDTYRRTSPDSQKITKNYWRKKLGLVLDKMR